MQGQELNRALRRSRLQASLCGRLFRAGDDPVCRFRFVAEHRGAWGVKRLCRVLGVSRSGFYACRVNKYIDDHVRQ